MTLGLAQKTTGLLRQTLPEALWTAGTSVLSSLPFLGADPLFVFANLLFLHMHV